MEKWEQRPYREKQVPEGGGGSEQQVMNSPVAGWLRNFRIGVTHRSHFQSGGGLPLWVLSWEGRPSCKEANICTHSGEKHGDELDPEDWDLSQDWGLEQKGAVETQATSGLLRNKWRGTHFPLMPWIRAHMILFVH